jgi:uncharacterized protein YjlB
MTVHKDRLDLPETLKARLRNADVVAHTIEEHGALPNNPKLPLLAYPHAVSVPERDPASIFEMLFTENGWHGTWRNGVYGYHHYHSTAHEVLGVYRGNARIQFGGDSGPVVEIQAGDVVVIPAGVAHKNLGDSGDLGIVGAYPDGQVWDMNFGKPEERPVADRNIAEVAKPKRDPVYGVDGPLFEHWP